MNLKPLVYIVPHTHWDRAWYVPVEIFRRKLMRLWDRALALLKRHPELCFVADGQTAMVLDYLTLRSEQRPRIGALVRRGQLHVGPWFTLPDEFLVCGEALLRNLEFGVSDARELGGVMLAGLIPDSFGHIAQLPQILNQFGITSVIYSRGLHGDTAPAEAVWEGPDGSTVLALFQLGGYFTGASLGYPGGCDTERVRFTLGSAIERIGKIMDDHAARGRTQLSIVHNGMDHLELQPNLPRIMQAARGRWPTHHFEFADYSKVALECRRRIKPAALPILSGPLTYPHGDMLKGVLSSRVTLKQANQRCEQQLTCIAEPLEALAWLVKPARGDERAVLREAWRQLLLNHPHDDICGCSCDEVHRANHVRFERIETMLHDFTREALRDIAHHIDCSTHDGVAVLLFNAAPLARQGAVRVRFDVETEVWSSLQAGFEVHDGRRKIIPNHLVEATPVVWAEVRNTFKMMRVTLDLGLGSLERWEFTTLYLASAGARCGNQACEGCVSAQARSLENEFVRVSLDEDGQVTLLHKATGRLFTHLHQLVTEGDRGDSYNWCPVAGEIEPIRPGKLRDARLTGTPLAMTLHWRQTLDLPREYDWDKQQRSRTRIRMPFSVAMTLRAGSPVVEFRLAFENLASDHRLRVCFPSGLIASHAVAGAPFGETCIAVDPMRRIGYRPDKASQLCVTEALQGYVYATSGQQGLALLTKGLYEHEAHATEQGIEMILTLLRATGWLSREDLATRPGLAGPPIATPQGQMHGRHVLEYAMVPFAAEQASLVPAWSLGFNLPVMAQLARFDDRPQWLTDREHMLPLEASGPLPGRFQLVTCADPNIIFTAMRRLSSDQLELRFYNNDASSTKVSMTIGLPVRRVIRARADGRKKRVIAEQGRFSLKVHGFEIVTLRLTIAARELQKRGAV